MVFSFDDILKAETLIRPYVCNTPVKAFETLNAFFHAQVYFKCENLQKAGAFKFRGATHAVQRLSGEEARRGVATHSSGNHAAALSLAARHRGVPAYIVMPSNSSETKIQKVREYGGEIMFCEPTLEARESGLEQVVDQTGATFVPPYDHPDIICGQATAALELLREIADADIVLSPVGGGGLLSGTALAAKNLFPDALVVGAEPAHADDALQSLKAGKIIPQTNPDTIADGLRTSLGKLTFEIISQYVDDIFIASEDAIREAMVMIKQATGMMVEPSSALPVAVMLENQEFFEGKKVGLIISGGNISPQMFDALTKGVKVRG